MLVKPPKQKRDNMRIFTVVGQMVSLGFLFCGATQAADTMHVRGTVAAVDGSKVMVKTNDGKDVSLVLGDGWKIAGVTKASMADIKQGTSLALRTWSARMAPKRSKLLYSLNLCAAQAKATTAGT